ncbi:MAG: hypothetical protein NC048_06000 [Bacteroides sp.]|nr:hypothetical protein [Ruminococcus flavefaciens]MCM1555029.1 hypothetical protein [Bacteroides sp.]
MVTKTYQAYFSRPGMGFDEAVGGLLSSLKELQNKGLQPVKIYIALGSDTQTDLAVRQRQLIEAVGSVLPGRTPTLTAVVQPPVDNSPLLAEIWCVGQAEACRFLNIGNLPHVLVEQAGITELWSSGFVADSPEKAFGSLSSLLEQTGFTYDDIFRQWNYVGHILQEKVMEGKCVQNYQHFNDIRALHYQNKRIRDQYPAATGIGMDCPGICIDFVAVKTAEGSPVRNLPVKSLVQKDAYAYQDKVLVGESVVLPAKNAPLFERGRCLKTEQGGLAMISGTASIKGEETVDLNDIKKQTSNTIEFIQDLLRNEAHARCARARLYVKQGQDPTEAVRIFGRSYPQDCVRTAVFADVCRDNLLIEIEADWNL